MLPDVSKSMWNSISVADVGLAVHVPLLTDNGEDVEVTEEPAKVHRKLLLPKACPSLAISPEFVLSHYEPTLTVHDRFDIKRYDKAGVFYWGSNRERDIAFENSVYSSIDISFGNTEDASNPLVGATVLQRGAPILFRYELLEQLRMDDAMMLSITGPTRAQFPVLPDQDSYWMAKDHKYGGTLVTLHLYGGFVLNPSLSDSDIQDDLTKYWIEHSNSSCLATQTQAEARREISVCSSMRRGLALTRCLGSYTVPVRNNPLRIPELVVISYEPFRPLSVEEFRPLIQTSADYRLMAYLLLVGASDMADNNIHVMQRKGVVLAMVETESMTRGNRLDSVKIAIPNFYEKTKKDSAETDPLRVVSTNLLEMSRWLSRGQTSHITSTQLTSFIRLLQASSPDKLENLLQSQYLKVNVGEQGLRSFLDGLMRKG